MLLNWTGTRRGSLAALYNSRSLTQVTSHRPNAGSAADTGTARVHSVQRPPRARQTHTVRRPRQTGTPHDAPVTYQPPLTFTAHTPHHLRQRPARRDWRPAGRFVPPAAAAALCPSLAAPGGPRGRVTSAAPRPTDRRVRVRCDDLCGPADRRAGCSGYLLSAVYLACTGGRRQ